MDINDAHCHFFSRSFFETLVGQLPERQSVEGVAERIEALGLEYPVDHSQLAKRWIEELDRNKVKRAALIASLPGDEDSVATAVAEYPERFVGFFMVDPSTPRAVHVAESAIRQKGLKCACLFPAMHHYHLYDESVVELFELVNSTGEGAVFAHCGALSVAIRGKLGLTSNFDMRYSNPLDLHSVALRFPEVPVIIPHFGAGLFREALMLADLCQNVYLDTSSSNSWVKYHPGLTLDRVFSQALEVVGPGRLLFGTDSSFFPRGWQRPIWERQLKTLEDLGLDPDSKRNILCANFERVFPCSSVPPAC